MSSYGTIIVRVFTSRAQIPMPGVRVAMTQKRTDGRYTLLASRVTDESGRTAPVRVDTPTPAGSLSPNEDSAFAVLDVLAQAPGFELLRIEDVQIFPDQVTLQNLELIPLPEYVLPGKYADTVIIPPQEL